MDLWKDHERSDGAKIVIDDGIAAVSPDGVRVTRCVCCGAPFATEAMAKRNADYLWPITFS